MKKLFILLILLLLSINLFAKKLKNSNTLILASLSNIENAHDFINKYLKEQNKEVFIFKSEGYYIVTYGIYDYDNQAVRSIKSLPNNLKSSGAFPLKLNYDLLTQKDDIESLVYFKDTQENIDKEKTNTIEKIERKKELSQQTITIETKNDKKIEKQLTKTNNKIPKNNEIKLDKQNQDSNFIDAISFGFGQNKESLNTYRVALIKEFNKTFYENSLGYLTGYFDLSLNRWEYHNNNIKGIAFSPVFKYYFHNNFKYMNPYIEAGIGAAYISETFVDSKNFSTHFQFEDRIGLGFTTKKYDFKLAYFHYSNGDIEKPNSGMDMLIITFLYPF